jgi:hypothetical protein
MEVKVWEFDEVLYLYFLYLNPIIVFCAFFNGWELIIIDIVAISIIDLIRGQSDSQVSGERLIHSVLKQEEQKMHVRERQRRVEKGNLIHRYIDFKMK